MKYNIKKILPKIDYKLLIGKFFVILFITIFFASLSTIVYNYIQNISKNSSTITNNNKIIFQTVSEVLYYVILSIGIVFILVQLGFNLNTILVALGSVGLAIALALQTSITNIASGFMIMFLNYYDIGDLVEIDDNLGYIDSFNLFNTVMKDLNDTLINIPNSSIVNGILTNYYKEKNIKVSFKVNISNYEKSTKINEISQLLKESLAEKCNFIIDKNEIKINVNDLSKEGTLLNIRFPVESKNYLSAKNMGQNIVRETIRELNVNLLYNYYKDN